MRWKLLVVASLVAAVVGAAGAYGVAAAIWRFSQQHPPSTLTLLISAEIVPLVASLIVGIFVYRHTARRRKLQVFLVVLFSLLLSQVLVRLLTLLLPIVPPPSLH